MFKRGQVTLFVIIAILLVGAVVLFLFLRPSIIQAPVSAEEAQKIVAAQSAPVRDLVIKCVEGPLRDAVIKVGFQGGYCNPVPVKYSQLGNYSVPYLVEKSGNQFRNNLLLLEGDGATISNEIVKCTDMEAVMKCINNFESFKPLIDVKSSGDLTFKISFIPPVTIRADIIYPLTLSKGSAKTTIKDMQLDIKSGLFNAYTAATDITNSEIKSHDFKIDEYVRNNRFITMDRQETYYYLTTVPIDTEEPYKFHFAVDI